MSQKGRKSGVNNTARVRGVLKKNSTVRLQSSEILASLGADLSENKVRVILSRLVQKGEATREGRGILATWKFKRASPRSRTVNVSDSQGFGTAIHEQVDAYIASTSSLDDRVSQVANKVPADEPDGTFKVQGSLVKGTVFMGTVVSMTSPGWSSRPYLITEL